MTDFVLGIFFFFNNNIQKNTNKRIQFYLSVGNVGLFWWLEHCLHVDVDDLLISIKGQILNYIAI